MRYNQMIEEFYALINISTYDNNAINKLYHLLDIIENNSYITNAQETYLSTKIDNFTHYYYNKIRSLEFFKLNNNFKNSSNYAQFICNYYFRLPENNYKKSVLVKLSKDLRCRKQSPVFKDLQIILINYSIKI